MEKLTTEQHELRELLEKLYTGGLSNTATRVLLKHIKPEDLQHLIKNLEDYV